MKLKKKRTTKIYLVENIDNNPFKVYIGKTKNCRKNNHRIKFGKQIEYVYIDEVNSLNYEDWEPLETYWIEQFKAWGFIVVNKRKTGGSGPISHTKITKQKIREKNLGKERTKETCLKLSKALKGREISQETRDKMSSVRLGIVLSKETVNKMIQKRIKPILQYDLEGNFIKEWNSIIEASAFIKRHSSGGIVACLKNKQKTAYGYIWKYKN